MTPVVPKGKHYPRAFDLVRSLGGYLTAGFSGPLSGTVVVSQGMVDAVRWSGAECPGDASKVVGRTLSLLTVDPREGSRRLVWRLHPDEADAVQFGIMDEGAGGFTFQWEPYWHRPGDTAIYRVEAGWGLPLGLPYVGGQCPALVDCPVEVRADGFWWRAGKAALLAASLAALILLL